MIPTKLLCGLPMGMGAIVSFIHTSHLLNLMGANSGFSMKLTSFFFICVLSKSYFF